MVRLIRFLLRNKKYKHARTHTQLEKNIFIVGTNVCIYFYAGLDLVVTSLTAHLWEMVDVSAIRCVFLS